MSLQDDVENFNVLVNIEVLSAGLLTLVFSNDLINNINFSEVKILVFNDFNLSFLNFGFCYGLDFLAILCLL